MAGGRSASCIHDRLSRLLNRNVARTCQGCRLDRPGYRGVQSEACASLQASRIQTSRKRREPGRATQQSWYRACGQPRNDACGQTRNNAGVRTRNKLDRCAAHKDIPPSPWAPFRIVYHEDCRSGPLRNARRGFTPRPEVRRGSGRFWGSENYAHRANRCGGARPAGPVLAERTQARLNADVRKWPQKTQIGPWMPQQSSWSRSARRGTSTRACQPASPFAFFAAICVHLR